MNELTPDASLEVALAFATGIEAELRDLLLTIGVARDAIPEAFDLAAARAVSLRFGSNDATQVCVAFAAEDAFARRLESSAADELFVSACTPALQAAAQMIGSLLGDDVELYGVDQSVPDAVAADSDGERAVVYPVLDGIELVGCFVIAFEAADVVDVRSDPGGAPAFERELVGLGPGRRPATTGAIVLDQIEIGLTAELGRARMPMRDFLSLSNGSVIDLDQPAGMPVNVVVNGAVIARGEVVVIDDEYGVRITEVLTQTASR